MVIFAIPSHSSRIISSKSRTFTQFLVMINYLFDGYPYAKIRFSRRTRKPVNIIAIKNLDYVLHNQDKIITFARQRR